MAGEQQPESNSSSSSRLSRRKVLALTSAASAGLAGCGGGGGGTTTQGDTPTEAGTPKATPPDTDSPTPTEEPTTVQTKGEQITDTIASHVGAWQPSNTNVNQYAPAGNEPPFFASIWFPLTCYYNNKGEIAWFAFDDAEFSNGGKTVTWSMKDDWKWWDGSKVTAEDYVMQLKINQYQQYTSLEAAPITYTVVDDTTFREERSAPVNPTARLLDQTDAIYTKRDVYREWLEKYKDASSEKAVNQVTTKLTQMEIGFDDAVKQGFGGCLFKPTTWNPQRVTWEKFDGHARSDWTNLSGWTWELVSGDQKFDQAFNAGRFDMGELNFNLVAQQNDNIENIAVMSLPGVPKLTINQHNKHLARRAVRKAIAYIIDHDELRKVLKANYGTPYNPHPYIDGMSSAIGNNWLGKGYQQKMNDYGSKAKPKKAKQVLRDAGYSKDGQFWVGPDGDPIKNLKYMSPPWSIYQSIVKYLAPILTEFGIGTKQVLPSRSNFYKRLNTSYDFDLLNWYHFGFHPTGTYYVGIGTPTGLDHYREVSKPVENYRDTPELTNDKSPRLQHPIRNEFPSNVGDDAMNGPTETLYPIKWVNIMGASQDKKEVVKLARKLAWYYNWFVPHIGFYEEKWNYWSKPDTYSFRGNHPESETDRTAREHWIPNEDMIQVFGGHVSSKYK